MIYYIIIIIIFTYLWPVHENNEPVVDGDYDVAGPDAALPGRATRHHVVEDEVQSTVLTEHTDAYLIKCLTFLGKGRQSDGQLVGRRHGIKNAAKGPKTVQK